MKTEKSAFQSGAALEIAILFTRNVEDLTAFYQETLDLGEFERSPDHMGFT